MPTFGSPEPISARIDVAAGPVRIRAAQRSTTVVDVRPANPRKSADVEAAAQTRVEFEDGRLLVTTPRRPRLVLFGNPASVEIDVLLPEGSEVGVDAGAGPVDCEGRLGDVRVSAKYGDIRIEHAAEVHAHTSAGNVSVTEADGGVDAGSSYGGIRIGAVAGTVRLDCAYGDLSVDRTVAPVHAATKYGQVRVGEAVRGSLDLTTAYGSVEIGVRKGTAAWLDVHSDSGRVRNLLDATSGPEDAGDTVEIRAHTAFGDVVVRRS